MLTWDHVWPYKQVRHHVLDNGYVVWRIGTGLNVEIVHLKSFTKRIGTGRLLLKCLLLRLVDEPPYETVYGFTRTNNEEAQAFYEAMGFDLSPVTGVYRDGSAVIFSQQYSILKEIHDVS